MDTHCISDSPGCLGHVFTDFQYVLCRVGENFVWNKNPQNRRTAKRLSLYHASAKPTAIGWVWRFFCVRWASAASCCRNLRSALPCHCWCWPCYALCSLNSPPCKGRHPFSRAVSPEAARSQNAPAFCYAALVRHYIMPPLVGRHEEKQHDRLA